MPHKQQLQIRELHPTFAAEVIGVDFSKPVPDDVFDEIKVALTKVRQNRPPAGDSHTQRV